MYSKYEKLLRERGLNSYKVSKATGISQTTLSDWKKGRSKPKLDKLLKIAEFLECDIKDLIYNEEQKNGREKTNRENASCVKGKHSGAKRKARIYGRANKQIHRNGLFGVLREEKRKKTFQAR